MIMCVTTPSRQCLHGAGALSDVGAPAWHRYQLRRPAGGGGGDSAATTTEQQWSGGSGDSGSPRRPPSGGKPKSAAAKRTAELQEKNRRAQRRFRERQKVGGLRGQLPARQAICCKPPVSIRCTTTQRSDASMLRSLRPDHGVQSDALASCVRRARSMSWRAKSTSSMAASARCCQIRRRWTAASASSIGCCRCARSTSSCCSGGWGPF